RPTERTHMASRDQNNPDLPNTVKTDTTRASEVDTEETINTNDQVTGDTNRDPITGAPGSHPIGTGVGAAAAGTAAAAAGFAIGATISGPAAPIGGAIGAVVGAIAGGLAGQGVAERGN